MTRRFHVNIQDSPWTLLHLITFVLKSGQFSLFFLTDTTKYLIPWLHKNDGTLGLSWCHESLKWDMGLQGALIGDSPSCHKINVYKQQCNLSSWRCWLFRSLGVPLNNPSQMIQVSNHCLASLKTTPISLTIKQSKLTTLCRTA